jgi:hypothetical protein
MLFRTRKAAWLPLFRRAVSGSPQADLGKRGETPVFGSDCSHVDIVV